MGIAVEEKTSKAGKPYNVLVITFNNGYVFETFLNNEQTFCIKSALERKEK